MLDLHTTTSIPSNESYLMWDIFFLKGIGKSEKLEKVFYTHPTFFFAYLSHLDVRCHLILDKDSLSKCIMLSLINGFI